MHREQLSYQMLTDAAKNENMTFANLLGGAVLEEVVRRISLSDYQENLWLRNGTIIGKERYERSLVLSLEYDYVIQKLKKSDAGKSEQTLLTELAEYLIKEVFSEADYGIQFVIKSKLMKKYLQLQLQAEIEGMKIPVSIKICLLFDSKKIPRKETFTSILFPKIHISYYSYPIEGFLAENFMEVITKLELIQNIKAYYDIYYLLEHKSVDGRKVKEYIEEQCEKLQITKEKSRLDMIAGYRDYGYMKKKWKMFLRSINSKEPEWEEVIGRFICFFAPIWQAVLDDRVFFGDWMPDLNRFL